jgi:hypothetical protein
MKTFIGIALLLCHALVVEAKDGLEALQQGMTYNEAKQVLVEQGWQPLPNTKITNSSLYAEEIYALGMTEVVDCISMALDACTFRFRKGQQVLELKTITRQLTFESYRIKR